MCLGAWSQHTVHRYTYRYTHLLCVCWRFVSLPQSTLKNYSDLDRILVRTLDFFDEIKGNPVLFSTFVLVLSSWDPSQNLPATRGALYGTAIRAVLERHCRLTDDDPEAVLAMLVPYGCAQCFL